MGQPSVLAMWGWTAEAWVGCIQSSGPGDADLVIVVAAHQPSLSSPYTVQWLSCIGRR